MDKGYAAPDHKREWGGALQKNINGCRITGLNSSIIGGIEFTEDIINAMDFERMEQPIHPWGNSSKVSAINSRNGHETDG